MITVEKSLPAVGTKAPDFLLTKTDLTDVTLDDFAGKKLVLNIFPSIDTSTCAMSVRKFNAAAASLENTVVVTVSKDLPFANRRFCGAEGIENVWALSQFRDRSFSKAYGVDMTEGRLKDLMSRNVVVIDENGMIIYTEACELNNEPNYDAALASLK